jgi:hypothetical protein
MIGACGGGPSNEQTEPPPNRAPIISGSPPTTVVAGQAYSFTPMASDADGDVLTFTISNRPSWANFAPGNGSLTGTPLAIDSGSYPNVSITVSDGQLTDTLAAFSIEVEVLPAGSVQLTWTPPSLNADGSMLNDLKGYRIRWRNQPGPYSNLIEINDSSANSSTVSNLSPATYFFVVTAVDLSGNESVFSNEATIDVP